MSTSVEVATVQIDLRRRWHALALSQWFGHRRPLVVDVETLNRISS
jgi:hypothetical protein